MTFYVHQRSSGNLLPQAHLLAREVFLLCHQHVPGPATGTDEDGAVQALGVYVLFFEESQCRA